MKTNNISKEPPKKMVVMKVGSHATENFEDIIKRKILECDKFGYTFWGYGGSICHPLTQVQPFCSEDSRPVYLAMIPTSSPFIGGSVEAKEFSPENDSWHPLPKGLRVLGSKYALVITSIIETDLSIDANQYTVAVGASLGKPLIQYLRARVDKACVNKVEKPKCLTANSMILNVKYVAKLLKPYAVFLR